MPRKKKTTNQAGTKAMTAPEMLDLVLGKANDGNNRIHQTITLERKEMADDTQALLKRIAELENQNRYLSQQNDMLRCRVSLLENLASDDEAEDDVVAVLPVLPTPNRSQ